MKPANYANALRTIIRARAAGKPTPPVIIKSAPGVGKSALTKQAAAAEGVYVHDVRAALRGPMDILGMPVVDDKPVTAYKRPDVLPPENVGPCVWFLDELDKAPPLTQNALLGAIHDREIHGHVIGADVTIVAAMNRAQDHAHSQRMSTALLSRFRQLDLESDVDDWTRYMLSAGKRQEAIAFIRFRPSLLNDFDPARSDTAFACQRTWEMASDILDEGHYAGDELEMLFGTVGRGVGAEFKAFLAVFRNCPTVESIVMDPDHAPIPTLENGNPDPGACYAICGNLAHRASPSSFPAMLRYINRLPADFGVYAISAIVTKVPEVQQTRPFVEWAARNAAVLF